MIRSDVLYMIKRRAKEPASLTQPAAILFARRGLPKTVARSNTAQQIAAHQSPRTTKLYDRTKDEISLDEVERIKF
jgi:integrase/recombinase XerD